MCKRIKLEPVIWNLVSLLARRDFPNSLTGCVNAQGNPWWRSHSRFIGSHRITRSKERVGTILQVERIVKLEETECEDCPQLENAFDQMLSINSAVRLGNSIVAFRAKATPLFVVILVSINAIPKLLHVRLLRALL